MPPNTPGAISPGRGELDVNAQRADHQQDQRDVRVRDRRDDLLPQRSLVLHDLRARRVQRGRRVPSNRVTVRPSSAASSCCSPGAIRSTSFWSSASLSVNDLLSRTAVSASCAVASALAADAAQVRGGVVLHLLLHHGIHLAAHQDRVRRAGCGSRRHGRDVARLQQEESGRCRAPAAGRHIGHHRNRRRDNLFDGGAHRVHQSARCVESHQDQRCIFVLGLCDCAVHNFGGDGMDHPVHVHRDDFRVMRPRPVPPAPAPMSNPRVVAQSISNIHPSDGAVRNHYATCYRLHWCTSTYAVCAPVGKLTLRNSIDRNF